MQYFHLSPKDPVNHLLLFDIDSLLSKIDKNTLHIEKLFNIYNKLY